MDYAPEVRDGPVRQGRVAGDHHPVPDVEGACDFARVLAPLLDRMADGQLALKFRCLKERLER